MDNLEIKLLNEAICASRLHFGLRVLQTTGRVVAGLAQSDAPASLLKAP